VLKVTADIQIDDSELSEQFVRASGPGGQNVNKVSSAVQLRFNVSGSRALTGDVRQRLIMLAGNRMTATGELVIAAQRFRNQAQNRTDARERLAVLIRAALQPPKPRRKTKPTAASKRRRLETKKRRSEIKQTRRGTF